MSTPRGHDQFRLGLLFATGSAITFGMSGPLAKSLMAAGWSPTAAVTARLAAASGPEQAASSTDTATGAIQRVIALS